MKCFGTILVLLTLAGCACTDTKRESKDERQERLLEIRSQRFERIP